MSLGHRLRPNPPVRPAAASPYSNDSLLKSLATFILLYSKTQVLSKYTAYFFSLSIQTPFSQVSIERFSTKSYTPQTQLTIMF